jgi:hypothetical protein
MATGLMNGTLAHLSDIVLLGSCLNARRGRTAQPWNVTSWTVIWSSLAIGGYFVVQKTGDGDNRQNKQRETKLPALHSVHSFMTHLITGYNGHSGRSGRQRKSRSSSIVH